MSDDLNVAVVGLTDRPLSCAFEHRDNLVLRQHHRRSRRALRPDQIYDPRQRLPQSFAAQDDEGKKKAG
jgi:hypothetical protein